MLLHPPLCEEGVSLRPAVGNGQCHGREVRCGQASRTGVALSVLIGLQCQCIRAGFDGVTGEVLTTRDAGDALEDTRIMDDGGAGFLVIAAGTFAMGSPTDEPCRTDQEDLHRVTLTRNYALAATETTRRQFSTVMGYEPSLSSACMSSDCPVDNVNWHEAAAFCNALSEQAGLTKCYHCTGTGVAVRCSPAPAASGAAVYQCTGYRLPTEAEWERAYRADSQTALFSGPLSVCSGADEAVAPIAWYDSNSGESSHPVAQKEPNRWGLYDMAGNVWEWCHDAFVEKLGTASVTDPWGAANGSLHLGRGGAWNEPAGHTRAAFRNVGNPEFHDATSGVRCARSL